MEAKAAMTAVAAKAAAEAEERRMLNRLESGAGRYACGGYLTGLDPLARTDLFTALEFDRLKRKYENLLVLHRESHEDWNQTFYRQLFHTLGDRQNRAAFEELAARVPYTLVMKERYAQQRVEALLIGCSGLLDRYPEDACTAALKRDFDYFRRKYDLEPMSPDAWDLRRIKPANHPLLRLSQLAVFFSGHDLVFEQALACRTADDLQRLFGAETSAYWRTHHLPGAEGRDSSKRIGVMKTNLLGINLVSILQYAYGSYVDREELRSRALALLEELPPEDNRYVRAWQAWGIAPRNAFETQALLQLATEYCARRRCRECPVGRRRLKITRQELVYREK